MSDQENKLPPVIDDAHVAGPSHGAGGTAVPQLETEAGQRGTGQEVEAVDVVRFNVPPYSGNLKTWFVRLEAQFRAARVKSAGVMFNVVIAQAPEHMIDSLSDEDVSVLAEKKDSYARLKQLLLKRFLPSDDERLTKLISEMGVGSTEKPSEIHRLIQGQANDILPENAVKKLWILKLPMIIQMLLMKDDALPMDQLVSLADGYFVKYKQGTLNSSSNLGVDMVQTSNNPFLEPGTSLNTPAATDQFALLAKAIETLTHEVAALKYSPRRNRSSSRVTTTDRGRSVSRKRSKARDGTPGRSNQAADEVLCWYHRRFGDRATVCRGPCQYNDNSDSEN